MQTRTGKILIIDDTASIREMIRNVIRKMGFQGIEEAPNGKVGLGKIQAAILEKAPFSLVFLDVNMPEVDGIKMLELLRQDQATRNLPVVMVTTESAKPTVIRAVMSGISGYIVKPFTNDEIRKKVDEVMEKAAELECSAGAE